ncbi:MAG: hypothetical protein M3552_06460 [Planctomycetota bacterium]|nr:hypothetical protein [Planctomycetaceae bacterium]MDQ3330278.1 hypothetical protein [Planctomycetota bacterium]
MKPMLMLALAAFALAGCSRPVARLDKLSRVQAAVLTDASGFGGGAQNVARPPIQVTDPDRLAALESFLTSRQSKWKKADGMPRPTRFQLQLIAGDKPLYTVWLEPGYLAMASGKKMQEARLSNADTAELLACLGLPPDYMNPGGMPAHSASHPMPYAPSAPGPQGVMPAAYESAPATGATKL